MTESVKIECIEIKIIQKECQCCYSPSNIFIEYDCQHLVCKKCYKKMKEKFNRDSCLFCDPLNESPKPEIKDDIIYTNNCVCSSFGCLLCCLSSTMVILYIIRILTI